MHAKAAAAWRRSRRRARPALSSSAAPPSTGSLTWKTSSWWQCLNDVYGHATTAVATSSYYGHVTTSADAGDGQLSSSKSGNKTHSTPRSGCALCLPPDGTPDFVFP